jgi:hypothetical protein
MKRFFFAALLLAPFLLSPVHTQVNSNLATAVAQLLDHPAPPPPHPKELAEALAAMKGPAIYYRDTDPPDPGEDAPIKVLMAYWGMQAREETGKQPLEKVRQRLLQACEEEPGFPDVLLEFLPNTPDAHARSKRILDEEPNPGLDPLDHLGSNFQQSSRRSLREWLMCNSEYLRDELIREAGVVKDDDGEVKGARQLTALARFDWRTAEPLLKNCAGGSAPLTAAFALGLLFEHAAQNSRSADADTYRDRLKRVISDPQAPPKTRAMAVEALMKTDWQGRDEWFLSLFADPTLSEMEDGYRTINALAGPVQRDPDRWIPIISRLIGHDDRNVHNAAAGCLAQFVDRLVNKRARKDALLPLLPWLSDPEWAITSDEYARSRLAESVVHLKMREALPELISILRNKESDHLSDRPALRRAPKSGSFLRNENGFVRYTVIRALADTPDNIFVPLLREAIRDQEKNDGEHASLLIRALIGSGGLTIEEMVAALESCAAKSEVDVDYDRSYRPLRIYPQTKSFEVSVGQIIAEQKEYASEALAAAVIERLKSLRGEKPDVATKLWTIARQWPFPPVEVAIVEQIADGSADLGSLLTACERRQDLRAHAAGALRELTGAGGYQAGVGAALLDDQAGALDILNGADRAARLALLACARMMRESLPVEEVGGLLKSPDKMLALAAERYLESEDGAKARKLIRALHPGETLILGARGWSDPKPESGNKWILWEDRLREDIKKNLADEIFATLESNYSDSAPFSSRHGAIVRVRQGKAELCKQKDAAREECRQLTDGELQSLRDLYEEVSFDDLGPIILPGNGLAGGSQEFIRLDKSGGRRVFASELYDLKYYLPYKAKKPHVQLEAFFERLCSTGEFELRYALKAKIRELEVLAADDQHPVKYVCKQGDEIRALVKEKDSGWNETNGERKREEEVWHWRSVINNKLGEIADQPDACPILDTQEDMPEEMRKGWHSLESGLWKLRSGRNIVRGGKWKEQEGLWLCAPGQEPKLIVEGDYSALLVTPDGNHLVAVTSGPFLGALIRIDLRTKQKAKVETDHFYYPVTLAPGSGKVYFHRKREEQDEHLLLDPASGKLEVVKGEFEPLGDQNFRPLQPVVGSREYWAAIPDSEKNLTRVGRYDARAFSFKPLMEIPEIRFTSEVMCVDEAAQRIYLAYHGHLLRLPLIVNPKSSGK